MKKKTIISLLTFVTSFTLTACSMQFSTKENIGQVPDEINNIRVDIANEISDIIDEADFKSKESLDTLTRNITDWANSYAEESESLHEFQKAKLVRVVDGDTIVVDIEGEEYKVRLIGVNTPESVHPDSSRNTEEGISSSNYTKNLLANVETLYLQKDTSETDKYGRLLRYVWLEMPEDEHNINEIATKMLNGLLLLDHVAEPAVYEPDTAHEEDFDWIYDNM